MDIQRSKRTDTNCLKMSIKRLGFLSALVLGIYILGFSGLLSAGDMEREDALGRNSKHVQVIKDLFVNSKLTAPQEILRDFTDGKSTIRVIVNIHKPAKANSLRNFQEMGVRQHLKETVRQSLDRLINALDPMEVHVTNRFTYIFGFSAEVTLQGLHEMTESPEIISIEKDVIIHAQLAQGIPLMNASTPRSSYTGAGLSIAVCDTGIDYTHPMLGNGSFPNTKIIGGYDCGDDDNDPMDPEGHGTACAGIAAGDSGSVGDYIGGVAYNARLYAIKISHGSSDNAYTSDMIEGWEWCITHQYDDSSNPIIIISTSFGGSHYFSTCDSTSTAMTTAAANAVGAGMTLFVSSGNDGYCDSIGWPACISHVISVGAVYDASLGRNPPSEYVGCIKNGSCVGTPGPPCDEKWYVDEPANADQVATYSNSASFLDLLAPSNWATTTKLGGGYWDTANGFGGTSAACPYTAGAAACLQNAAKALTGSYLTPAEVKSTLINTGDLITDEKVSITKPRVNLGSAVDSLGESSTFYVESTGSCDGNTPCYSTIQAAVDDAEHNTTILVAGGSYDEDVSLSTSNNLTFKGGYNSTFTTQSSETTLNTLTINNGCAELDRLTLLSGGPWPKISYSGSDPYDFGTVQVGSSSTYAFTIQNTGSDTLNISGATVSGTGFSVVGSVPGSISAGESDTITVGFSPGSVGSYTGTLSINSDDPNTPILNIGLNGTGESAPQQVASSQFYNSLLCGGSSFTATLTLDGQALTSVNGAYSYCEEFDCGESINWNLYANTGGCGIITINGSTTLDCDCLYSYVLTLSGGVPALVYTRTCPGDCSDVSSVSIGSMDLLDPVVLTKDADLLGLTVFDPVISE